MRSPTAIRCSWRRPARTPAIKALYKDLPFDPVKDFAPLTLVTLNPQLIVSGAKYRDLDFGGLVGKLKEAGAAANFGSSGIGSATHIAGELFNRETGAALVHVPYRGQGPALNDLLGGRLDVMFPLVADVFPFIQSGQVKPFAVMNDRPFEGAARRSNHRRAWLSKARSEFDLDGPLHQRRNTATDRRGLNRELVKIITARAFVERFEAAGYEIKTTRPEELRAFAAAETARWGAIIRNLNIQLE